MKSDHPVRLATAASERSSWIAYTPAWVVSVLLIAVLLAARGIVTSIYTHDLYVVFDGGWRTYLGQRPYVDFHSPVGIAYFLPYVLLRQLEPFSLSTLLHANAVVAIAFLLLATWTLTRRLSPFAFFLAAIGIVTVVISPRAADWAPDVFSHLAPYNRWCEGAMMLIAPLVLLAPCSDTAERPGASVPRPDFAAAVTVALITLFLFHTKVTYFLCTMGVIAVGLATRQISWRTIGIAAAFVLAGSALLELTLHLHRPYLADLDMARRGTLENLGKIKVANRRWGGYMLVGYGLAVIALLRLWAPPQKWRAIVVTWWRLLVIAGGGLLIAALANTQNHVQFEIPLMGILLLVVVELLRRQCRPRVLRRSGRALWVAIVIIGAATSSLFEAASVVAHTLASRDGSTCPVPALAGTPGEQLLFDKGSLSDSASAASTGCGSLHIDPSKLSVPTPEAYLLADSARLEVVRLDEAHALLAGRLGPGDRIIAMDFANPYSVFSATVPASGALLWWDFGRNYSKGFHPDSQRLLGSVNFVLESKYDPENEPHGKNMWKVYRLDVMRQFSPVAGGSDLAALGPAEDALTPGSFEYRIRPGASKPVSDTSPRSTTA